MNLANKITVARIGLIPLFILLLYPFPDKPFDPYGMYWAAAIFIIAAATDQLDGYVARKYNQVTKLGMLLDPLADKLLICAALLLLVQMHSVPAWIAFGIIGREIVITGLRIMAAKKRIALAADRYGKIKLVVQVVAIAAVLLDNVPFRFIVDWPVDQVLMLLALMMTVVSGYNYIKNNYARLELHK